MKRRRRPDPREVCARHLRDLRRAYRAYPANVDEGPSESPQRLHGPDVSSGCSSPAAWLAEIAG